MQKLGNNLSLWKFEGPGRWWRFLSGEMCEFIWHWYVARLKFRLVATPLSLIGSRLI